MKKNINLILIFILLTSCSGFKLKDETRDEFLVEKKSPLVVPPSYGQLPLPDSEIIKENKESENEIKDLLIKKSSKKTDDIKQKKNSSLETSILEKIQ